MEWLDDDVTYGVACALLLMLLVREVLATVAQYCVPLSRTLSWLLPTPLLHIIATCLEPIYEHLTDSEVTRKDVSTQVCENEFHQSDLSLTFVPRDQTEVNAEKAKVECNGDISANSSFSHEHHGYSDYSLRRRVDSLNAKLTQSQQVIVSLRQNEQKLRQRLGGHLMDRFDKNQDGKFEDISQDDFSRPTSLIRRYHNIYSDERVELLDVLEQNGQGQNNLLQGRLENDTESRLQPEQLLVSIVVECFESTQRTIGQLTDALHRQLLQLLSQKRRSASTTTAAAAAADDDVKPELKHFDDAVFSLLRQVAARRDSFPCVETIGERFHLDCEDNTAIKNSNEFRRYITTCARLAWFLTAQRPFYVLEYQLRGAIFDDERHQRFHSSDPSSSVISQVIWPALVEQSTRYCVSKAVVVT